MRQELLKDIHAYLQAKVNRTQDEEDLLVRIRGQLPYFHITSIHRDDLLSRGFDVSEVTDADMQRLAGKLSDDYCNQLFWESLDIIAEDSINIPREKCPLCQSETVSYEADHFKCDQCAISWPHERFALISSDVVDTVREKGIGYTCIDLSKPHAQYIPLSIHSEYFTENYTPDMVYRIVTIEDYSILDKLIEAGYRIDQTSLFATNEYGRNTFWVSVEAINYKEEDE